MKRAEYTAAVTSVYRKYIDLALTSDNKYQVSREDMQILMNAGNRKGFSNSYYFDHNGRKMISFDKPDYDTGGEEGLSDKRGRHKTDDEVDELERLRRENLRLKRQLEEKDMVVELLKKVKEFEGM